MEKYDFVSTVEGIDVERIVKEAPKGTPFILIEVKEKDSNRKLGWALLVRNSVLNHPDLASEVGEDYIRGYSLGERDLGGDIIPWIVGDDWGSSYLGGIRLHSFRVISGEGKFPGYIKQEIAGIRGILNPKNIRTTVSYV